MLTVFATNGTSVLATANANPAGVAESLADVTLPTAGTYYARITGADDTIQLYELSLTVVTLLPGDFNFDGYVDAADYVVCAQRPNPVTQAEYNTVAQHFGETVRRRCRRECHRPRTGDVGDAHRGGCRHSFAASPYCKRVPKTQFRVRHHRKSTDIETARSAFKLIDAVAFWHRYGVRKLISAGLTLGGHSGRKRVINPTFMTRPRVELNRAVLLVSDQTIARLSGFIADTIVDVVGCPLDDGDEPRYTDLVADRIWRSDCRPTASLNLKSGVDRGLKFLSVSVYQ